jgi:hypothetical protein
MYLRHWTIRKGGKSHTYCRLVRSVREGRKVRQETVAYLGELDAEGRAKASALAKHFLGGRTDQLELFEDRRSLDAVRVDLKGVRVESRAPERSLRSSSGSTVWTSSCQSTADRSFGFVASSGPTRPRRHC